MKYPSACCRYHNERSCSGYCYYCKNHLCAIDTSRGQGLTFVQDDVGCDKVMFFHDQGLSRQRRNVTTLSMAVLSRKLFSATDVH